LERLNYPVAYGPNGVLIGFGASRDLDAGEFYI